MDIAMVFLRIVLHGSGSSILTNIFCFNYRTRLVLLLTIYGDLSLPKVARHVRTGHNPGGGGWEKKSKQGKNRIPTLIRGLHASGQ